MVLIRNIREDDAKKFLSLLIQLDNETKLMLYEPEERKIDIDKMRLMIKEAHPSSFIYVVENWAIDNGVTRLELTVMKHNERAINLYKKIGYKVEGVREKSVVVDGDHVDEYYMAKIIRKGGD